MVCSVLWVVLPDSIMKGMRNKTHPNRSIPKPTMNKLTLSALLLLPVSAVISHGATTFNAPITAIFGSGNPDGGWVSSVDNNIELGLRAKDRNTGDTPNNGAGTYSFATGFSSPANNRAIWNFEFSINSDDSSGTDPLSSYRYVLSYDTNPSQGQTWASVDPLTLDNSYGNDATANGAGVEPVSVPNAVTLIAGNNIAQNSGNIMFAGTYPGFPSPTLDATYDFKLTAYSVTDTAGTTPLAQTSMRVNVGQGGAAVPDAGSTLVLLSSAMLGLFGFANFRKGKGTANA